MKNKIYLPEELEMWLLANGIHILNNRPCYRCKNLTKCARERLICKKILIKK